METELNQSLKQFFQLPTTEITYDKIKKFFQHQDTNEYGNLLHAAVENQFEEKKVLEFITILLKNNYDVNYKSKRTGYNFIQLALYGYTDDDGIDHSYTTTFIINLINLAKQYNLDVNTKDGDGDSIVHTAIASEVYEGKIVPILEALGENFDIECKDNANNNLINAFKLYKKEAEASNQSWYKRLCSEEQELQDRLEQKQPVLENLIKQEKVITQKIEQVLNKITLVNLKENGDKLLKLKDDLNQILSKKALVTQQKNTFSVVWKKYETTLKKMIREEIALLEKNFNIDQLNEIIIVLGEYHFLSEIKLIKSIINKYTKKVNQLKKKIDSELTISNQKELKEEISELSASDQEKLLNKLNKNEQKLIITTEKIRNLINTYSYLLNNEEEVDYSNCNQLELNLILDKIMKILKIKKEQILQEKKEKLETCINEILMLEDENLFLISELQELIVKTSNCIPKEKKIVRKKKIDSNGKE